MNVTATALERRRNCNYDVCKKLESRDKEYKSCAGCKQVVYCGADCQKADWKAHKKVCKASPLANQDPSLAQVIVLPEDSNLRAYSAWIPKSPQFGMPKLAELSGCSVDELKFNQAQRGEEADSYNILLFQNGASKRPQNIRASIILTALDELMRGNIFCTKGEGIKARGMVIAVRVVAESRKEGNMMRYYMKFGPETGLLDISLQEYNNLWGLMQYAVLDKKKGLAMGTVMPRSNTNAKLLGACTAHSLKTIHSGKTTSEEEFHQMYQHLKQKFEKK